LALAQRVDLAHLSFR